MLSLDIKLSELGFYKYHSSTLIRIFDNIYWQNIWNIVLSIFLLILIHISVKWVADVYFIIIYSPWNSVVFFGLKHEKASLDYSQLKNLDMSQFKDGKKSAALKKALEEVSEHIRNVKKRFGTEVLKKLKFERYDYQVLTFVK